MHELSLSSAILETVERHADGRPVSVVTLTIGALRQVVPESLDFYWGIVSRDTVCEGSKLEQNLIKATMRCRDCERTWDLDYPDFRCQHCGAADVEPLTGSEFEVESIEVEEEEEEARECTAQR